tara:strand:- start:1019 stop:1576 length:558 start_codon:yes stop_codon:yes gene_type:complete
MKNLTLIFAFILVASCGIYKPVDSRKIPVNVDERAAKNIAEGRSFRLGDITKKGGGSFEFASSNEMWRASIDLLDFAPFSNVDYSGGIIITDWFADENTKNAYFKITVRFLSNEIRADGLKIIIHKKTCDNSGICSVSKVKSTLSQEIKLAILKEAAILKEKGFVKDPNYKYPLGRETKKKKKKK